VEEPKKLAAAQFSLGGLAIQGVARCAPAERNAADTVKGNGNDQPSRRPSTELESPSLWHAGFPAIDVEEGQDTRLTVTDALDVSCGGKPKLAPAFCSC
jgi:hypothetical protein